MCGVLRHCVCGHSIRSTDSKWVVCHQTVGTRSEKCVMRPCRCHLGSLNTRSEARTVTHSPRTHLSEAVPVGKPLRRPSSQGLSGAGQRRASPCLVRSADLRSFLRKMVYLPGPRGTDRPGSHRRKSLLIAYVSALFCQEILFLSSVLPETPLCSFSW